MAYAWMLVIGFSLGQIDWSAVKRSENITLQYIDPSLSAPELLPSPINTFGWEDSAEINGTGNVLTFLYTRLDLHNAAQGRPEVHLHTPPRPGFSDRPNKRYDSDLYSASFSLGKWGNVAPFPTPINDDARLDGSLTLVTDRTSFNQPTLFFSRSWDGRRGIFLSWMTAGGWTVPSLVPNINDEPLTHNTADNPFVRGKTLYFEKHANGSIDLFTSTLPLCFESTPIANVNTTSNETQPFVDPQGNLYFTRDFAGFFRFVPSTKAISIIALANPSKHLAGIGEPTLDNAGNLYFVVVFKAFDVATQMDFCDADIAVMRRKK